MVNLMLWTLAATAAAAPLSPIRLPRGASVDLGGSLIKKDTGTNLDLLMKRNPGASVDLGGSLIKKGASVDLGGSLIKKEDAPVLPATDDLGPLGETVNQVNDDIPVDVSVDSNLLDGTPAKREQPVA